MFRKRHRYNCLCLKAEARALGDDDLPSNTICKVLEGFGKLSTKSFNDFCSSQIALRRGSFYADIMRGTSLQSQLNNLLNDIEVTYLDLVGGNSWLGIAAAPTQSSFTAKVQQDEEDEHEARALAAKSNLPWDEWVKLHAKRHHCGEKDTFACSAQITSRKSSPEKSSKRTVLTIAVNLKHVLPIAASRKLVATNF